MLRLSRHLTIADKIERGLNSTRRTISSKMETPSEVLAYFRQRSKEYYQKNREKVLKHQLEAKHWRSYYERNREAILARRKAKREAQRSEN